MFDFVLVQLGFDITVCLFCDITASDLGVFPAQTETLLKETLLLVIETA